ncbi:DoxX family protein [Kitasatospora sp. NPDC101801]|uniref:DoxX family protein n=1 Tax=Kitasatospora sp. NPDC101801 TaxID=3364103 RepID=UPI003826FBB1
MAGIDAGPGLNTVKVPSDPARLSSTQASFRVRLAAPVAPLIDAPAGAAFGDPYGMAGFTPRPMVTPQVVVGGLQVPALAGAGGAVVAGATPVRRKGRVTAVTWTGQAPPGDLAATQLLEAVRLNTVPAPARPVGGEATEQLQAYRPARPPVPEPVDSWAPTGELPEVSAVGTDYGQGKYPGRKVDLGLVLLPLRIVLGSLSVYAGFSKLCDPVYFDGGDRGSMMRWLSSLHPWGVAQPLLDFAMAHPVGSGLAVAFIQIVVGVLSILGLWQRVAAGTAMALSAALLFTVSWRAVPVYDTPDLIFLAAWSPLLIAGAPFGSLDGRIALEAWRRYGSSAPAALRRRILRRSGVVTAVVVGLTLLLGSMLGAAVRTGGRPDPVPVKPPTDFGSPMWPGNGPSPTPAPAGPAPKTPAPSPTLTPAKSGSAKPRSTKSESGSVAPAPTKGAPAGSGTGSTGTSSTGGTPAKPASSGTPGLLGGVLGAPLLVGMGAGSAHAAGVDA